MIEVITVDKVEQVMELIFDQPYDERNKRYRGYYMYRGLPDVSFKLKTSLQRNCGDMSTVLEPKLLNNFIKYTATEPNNTYNNIWRSMILGQHHGLPTRLMDWTHSPLVGLHFAVSDGNFENIGKNDCVVWRINAEEVHELLPEKFQAVMNSGAEKDTNKAITKIFSVDMLNDVVKSLEEYDALTNGESMVVIEPPSIDPRIVNQYSFFTVIPNGITDVEKYFEESKKLHVTKYVIKADLKWRIRDFLDEANISERTIYPGLDGICKWLARHYYVK